MKFLNLLVIILGLFVSSFCHADVTASTKASAKLSSMCEISMNALIFGAYDPNQSSGTTSTGNIGVRCTRGTIYIVGADAMRQTCGSRQLWLNGNFTPGGVNLNNGSYNGHYTGNYSAG